jgi:hypothetical protein
MPVAVEVVRQELGQSDGDGAVLEHVDLVAIAVGLLGRRLDVEDDDRGLGRNAALLVGGMIGDRDRAVEIGRRR